MSLPRYPKYKDSDISWIGEIPEHWQSLRLANVFKLQSRPVRDSDEIVTAFRDGKVTLRSKRRAEGFTNAVKEIGYQGIRAGDLVIHAMDAFAGAIGVSDSDGKSTPVYSVCTPIHSKTLTRYYGFLLRYMALSGYINSLAKGIRERSTDFRWADARTVIVPVPSSEEQIAIVWFLDQETARIDALIEEQRRLIDLLKEKRQAVISHAVTKGLDPSVAMTKSKSYEGLSSPSNWQVVRVKYLIARIEQGWSPQCDNFPAEGNEWGVLKAGAVNSGILDPSENKRLPPEIEPDSSLSIRKDDVLISRANTRELVGSAAVALSDYPRILLCDKIYRIELDIQTCLPAFITHFLRTPLIRGAVEAEASGASQSMQNISQDAIKELEISLPSLQEQSHIISVIEAQLQALGTLSSEAEHSIALLQERRSALISAAVTGKIDVRAQVKQPVQTTWSSGFARQVIAAEALTKCNGPSMGRIKLQKLIHLCEYHAQLDEIGGNYARKAAGPFDPEVMAGVRHGLKQQKWFEEYKDGERYAYRPMDKTGGHTPYLTHWAEKQPKIDEVLSLFSSARTRTCEIASTLYAAWNDLLIEGKGPTDDEIIHEASSAERWHKSKEKIAPEKWPTALQWMRTNGLVPVGYGSHTKRAETANSEGEHEPA